MMIDLVKYLILTEKSVRLIENNQYTFDVDLRITKPQIKKLIEDFFKVQVVSVNTHRLPRTSKAQYKRVIVTLKSGDSIPIFSEEN
jgi:large subunit ribosomal protein L23|uniref:Large ribosomal subunit protein uL23c n=1 Tax=Binuclearia lauterbornii TaxID=3087189 RepID=A0A097KPB1_9CHLO|nr:ribosomal protein L23 [Binuclearia lauterbornii]AIT95038.1 ribosomal protein L23 [Binuclearia lauterbornii]